MLIILFIAVSAGITCLIVAMIIVLLTVIILIVLIIQRSTKESGNITMIMPYSGSASELPKG